LLAQGNGLFTRQDEMYWSLKSLNRAYESSLLLLLLTVILWVSCMGLMFGHIGPTLRTMWKQKAVLAFAVLAFISTVWSQDPWLTFRKATLLFLLFAFAWFFATYYSPADQRRLLLAAGVIVAVASIAMALLLPQYGISTGGEWKGVFGHKNHMGLGIFYLFSGLPFCAFPNNRRLLTVTLQASLPIGLILLSQSKTSLILSVVLIAVRIFGPFIARGRREQLPFMIYMVVSGILCAVLALTVGRDIVLPLIGRDASFTGRTDHWAILLSYAFKHLWLGYGFHAFWTGTGDSLSVVHDIGATMKGSDSGYVDTMLQFGLLGMGMLLILLLVCVRDFARLFRHASISLMCYWYVGVIIATFVGNFTEMLSVAPDSITTFVFVLACAGLQRLSNEVAQ
jgi:O-antigen ligase